MEEISPRLFSFNAPFGACPTCAGLGIYSDVSEDLILRDGNLSINQGAFNATGWRMDGGGLAERYIKAVSKKYGIDLDCPLNQLPRKKLDILLYGNNGEKLDLYENDARNKTFEHSHSKNGG